MGWADRLIKDTKYLVNTPIGGLIQEAGKEWNDITTGNRQGQTDNPLRQMLSGPGGMLNDLGRGVNKLTTGKSEVQNPVSNSAETVVPAPPPGTVPTTTPPATVSPDSKDFREGTAWDTSPEYAVVSRLTTEERKKIEATSNGYALSKNAAEITLKHLADAGVEIDNGLKMQFRSSVHDASREWAQMQAATGRSINATTYMYFLTNFLLSAQQQQVDAEAASGTSGGTGEAPTEEQKQAAIDAGAQLYDSTGQVSYSTYNDYVNSKKED